MHEEWRPSESVPQLTTRAPALHHSEPTRAEAALASFCLAGSRPLAWRHEGHSWCGRRCWLGAGFGAATSLVNDLSSPYGELGGRLERARVTWVTDAAEVGSLLLDVGWAWAAVAVAAGWLVGAGAIGRGAAAGAVSLVAATAAYFVAMDSLLREEPLAGYSGEVRYWLLASLTLGPFLGAVGASLVRAGVTGLVAWADRARRRARSDPLPRAWACVEQPPGGGLGSGDRLRGRSSVYQPGCRPLRTTPAPGAGMSTSPTRSGSPPEEVRLDLAAPMSSRWFVSLYGDTAGAAVGQGVNEMTGMDAVAKQVEARAVGTR